MTQNKKHWHGARNMWAIGTMDAMNRTTPGWTQLLWICVCLGGAGCPNGQLDGFCSPGEQGVARGAIVYDSDDRTEIYLHPSADLQSLTRQSIVALVDASAIDTSNPRDVRVLGPSLGEGYGVCPDQAFVEQPAAAFCSGTLIDDDLVLTAGHCLLTEAHCRATRFVFDYAYEGQGELANIDLEAVYSCRRLVMSRDEDVTDLDFAVVQLDRPVTGQRRPAPLRLYDEPLASGDALTVIGFGTGIPAKIDDGAKVIDARARIGSYFSMAADTFAGIMAIWGMLGIFLKSLRQENLENLK